MRHKTAGRKILLLNFAKRTTRYFYAFDLPAATIHADDDDRLLLLLFLCF